jgi:hypothetical protein
MFSAHPIKSLLAVVHSIAGLLSIFIVATYVSVGTAEDHDFSSGFEGIPVAGLSLVIGVHALNAITSFAVAYALWKSSEWGRPLIFAYDGFIFLIFLSLMLFSSLASTSSRVGLSFFLFSVFVLLICGSTIAAAVRSSNPE